jgi:hypothetical protein
MGSWMRTVASYLDGVPNFVSLPILLALVGGFLYAVLKKGSDSDERQESESSPAVGARARAADHA